MGVPWLIALVGVVDGHATHTRLHHAPGHEAGLAKSGCPIHLLDMGRFLFKIHGIGCLHLHAISNFHRLNLGFQVPLIRAHPLMTPVESLHQIQLLALVLEIMDGVANMTNQTIDLEIGSQDAGGLIFCRKKAIGP